MGVPSEKRRAGDRASQFAATGHRQRTKDGCTIRGGPVLRGAKGAAPFKRSTARAPGGRSHQPFYRPSSRRRGLTFIVTSGRVAGRHRCLPAPSEPYGLVSSHTAQALDNASVRIRGDPMGLGGNLCVTAAEPATARRSVVEAAPAQSLRPRRLVCVASSAGGLSPPARQHQREVCPLARGVMLPPLAAPLPDGLRLLPPP